MTDKRRDVQHHDVGVSVEALASALARRDQMAAGSVVVVDNEIAARRRGGEPWLDASDNSLNMAMILRPDVDLGHLDLLWLVGTLGAARAGSELGNADLTIRWPDSIEVVGDDTPVGTVNVVTHLGPGRVERAVIAIRFRLGGLGLKPNDRQDLVNLTADELENSSALLATDQLSLIDDFTERAPLIGSRVKASLLPRGEARGRATAIDPQGRLVLESATGMIEYVAVDSLRTLVPS